MDMPDLDTLPTTVADARLMGSLWYFTGRACPNGHTSARRTKNSACYLCEYKRIGGYNEIGRYADFIEYHMLKTARRRARRKGVPFNLKAKDIVIPDRCPVLGIPLSVNGNLDCKDNSPSLDRIIPDRGYVVGNIIIVSNKANRIKTNASPDEVILVGTFYKELLQGVIS